MKKILCAVTAAMVAIALIPVMAIAKEAQAESGERFTVYASAGDKYKVSISGTFDYSSSREMMQYINKERLNRGRDKLTLDAGLTNAAMQRAAEIAYYFSHTRPDNRDCYTVNHRVRGENIAAGYFTAKETYMQWYNSKGHYENMVRDRFTNIGIGHFVHNGQHYWVQLFSEDGTKAVENRTGKIKEEKSLTVVEKKLSPLQVNGGIKSAAITTDQLLQLRIGTVNAGWPYASCMFDAESFNWISSNTAAAVVSGKGQVIPTGPGQTTITAKVGSASTSIRIGVTGTTKTVLKGTSISKVSTPDKSQIRVAWIKKPASQVTGYQLRYDIETDMNDSKVVLVQTANTNSKVITGLKPKKKYFVQIRTYKMAGSSIYYSPWSAKKQIKTK